MGRQKYGIGKQDFASMIERGFVYADKTQFIIRLLEGSDLYFLSRPRRFGKSLFLSTLKQFFRGRKELFKGLAIETYEWNWEPYPVIHISFGQGSFNEPNGLKDKLDEIIQNIEKEYGIKAEGDTFGRRLQSLVRNLHESSGKGVVILIDEYEKPLLDSYGTNIFDSNRNELANFYSVFKDNTEYMRLLFITGITRFGKLNIFSGLNNLKDISLHRDFSAICGITREELSRYFMPGIEAFASYLGATVEETLNELKDYYDGYHFSSEFVDIYNPWSLINCLDAMEIKSEWFSTGSPSYLLNILREKDYDIKGLLGSRVRAEQLSGSGLDMMDPTALLYQSGYLTIRDYDQKNKLYTIGLPNFEVRTALLEVVIPFYLNRKGSFQNSEVLKIAEFMDMGEAKKLMEWLAAYFSKISFYSKMRFEKDFEVLMLSIFLLVKDFSDVHCEYSMSSGVTDLVAVAGRYVYVFEFKIDRDAESALKQIDFRNYALPWTADGRKVFKIGAAFSTDNNGILHYSISE